MTSRGHAEWRLRDPDDPLAILARNVITQALDQRWRAMVGTAALVGLLAALAVALPLTLLENAATDRAARSRATHNCQLVTRVATIMGSGDPRDPKLRSGGFLSSDATMRAVEATRSASIRGSGPLASVLNDPATRRLERANATTERQTLEHWRRDLIPALLDAARADCST